MPPKPGFPINLESPTIRALAVGLLILLLQIPLALVSGLSDERRELRDTVALELGEKWGHAQTIVGPWIEVPYEVGVEEGYPETRMYRVLPVDLAIEGDVSVQQRARGIFEVPVYDATLQTTGAFEVPELADADVVHWDRAQLVVEVSDPSAIHDASNLSWDGAEHGFTPGAATTGVQASAPVGPPGTRHEFSFALELAGTQGLFVVPVGEDSQVVLRSGWPHPSFQGGWLPTEHTVDEQGFTASWHVTDLARGFPTQWGPEAAESMLPRLRGAAVGVTMGSSVDHYVMSARSTRYAILFFLAVFGVLWVLEMRGGFRLHPIHYLLTGAALCCFHLLTLAFGEHLGFGVAYALAAGMVTLLLIYYAHGALRNAMGAAAVGTTCLAIYGYLYVCLANEDHALLFGAIGVFVGIATVMVLTRKMAWVAPVLDEDPGPDVTQPSGTIVR
jgi:inner membrane protein